MIPTRSAGSGEVRHTPPLWPGMVTAVTAGYAIAYLWWERTGLGSPGLRDLVGNIAFMPLNLGVPGTQRSRLPHEQLDPAVRRALRLLALGALAVLIGNAVSVCTSPLWAPTRRFPGPTRSTWATRFCILGPSFVPPRPPHPDGAVEVRARRCHGPGGRRVAIWFWSVRPLRPKGTAAWSRSSPTRTRW